MAKLADLGLRYNLIYNREIVEHANDVYVYAFMRHLATWGSYSLAV